jgi:hypothetical protein
MISADWKRQDLKSDEHESSRFERAHEDCFERLGLFAGYGWGMMGSAGGDSEDSAGVGHNWHAKERLRLSAVILNATCWHPGTKTRTTIWPLILES